MTKKIFKPENVFARKEEDFYGDTLDSLEDDEEYHPDTEREINEEERNESSK